MLAQLRSLWRGIWKRKAVEAELDDELKFHLESKAEEFQRAGLPREEAMRRARVEFGGVSNCRESCRESRRANWFEDLWRDLRHGIRSLQKSPGFAAVAILTLGLGIGANTAIFSVMNAVLFRPLAYEKPRELVTWRHNESLMDVQDIRARNRAFSAGGAVNEADMDFTGGAEPLQVHAGYVDAGFFDVLGVPAMMGRVISPSEDQFGATRVAVLTYNFWRVNLGGDPNVLGKALPLSGNLYTVIGVMPPSFELPQYEADLFVALKVAYPEAAKYRGVHFMQSYWRLKPGVTLRQANEDMARVDGELAKEFPDEEKARHSVVVPLQQWTTRNVSSALWVLFAAVGTVLLIACTNFASLLVVRGIANRRVLTVRAALGAGRQRLVRQALAESTLLALLGGALGLALASFGTDLLSSLEPASLAQLRVEHMDSTVLLFALGVSLLTGIIFGIGPALSTSRANIADALKDEARTTSGSGGRGMRRVLVISETAMALVLLVGAGLLLRGFLRLQKVEPGFNSHGMVTFAIQLPAARYEETPKQTEFRRELLRRLNSLPGVQAAMVSDAPLNGNELTHNMAIDGRAPVAVGDEPEVDSWCVMGDFFQTMQIPLRAGRLLTEADRENQLPIAVVNEAFAKEFFAKQDVLGQRIRWAREHGAPRWMTIVGVVGDVKQFSLSEAAAPAVYTPFAQSNEPWRRWMTVVLRTSGASAGLISEVKQQLWSLDSQIPVNHVETMDQLVEESLSQQKFNMLLLGIFAALALVLAAVGIYGVMSYHVSQRTREIGIRMALGARGGDVLKMVAREGLWMTAAGIVIGVAAALLLTRWMSSLLFEVTPSDPATFAGVILVMGAVAMLACYIPGRRAVRVDPLVALRYE